MIQEVTAQYDTVYQSDPGTNDLTIVIQPGSAGPNTISAELLLEVGEKTVNNAKAEEGDLVMQMRNTLKDVDFEIDDDGNLIIHAPDADNYSIDDNGNLIYTYR